jgi:hypothetical protein
MYSFCLLSFVFCLKIGGGNLILSASKTDYERRDINPKTVIVGSVAGTIILIVILVLLSDYFMIAKENIVYETNLKPVSAELRDIRAMETETLTNYKLLDKSNGVYQIPIERAMQLMAEESFKTRLNELRKSR